MVLPRREGETETDTAAAFIQLALQHRTVAVVGLLLPLLGERPLRPPAGACPDGRAAKAVGTEEAAKAVGTEEAGFREEARRSLAQLSPSPGPEVEVVKITICPTRGLP